MPHPNVHTFVGGDQLQKTEDILIVVKRLSHAHQHHVGNPNTLILLSRLDLGKHLGSRQIPREAALPRGAEANSSFCTPPGWKYRWNSRGGTPSARIPHVRRPAGAADTWLCRPAWKPTAVRFPPQLCNSVRTAFGGMPLIDPTSPKRSARPDGAIGTPVTHGRPAALARQNPHATLPTSLI